MCRWAEFLHRVFVVESGRLLPDRSRDEATVLDVGCGPSVAGVISASAWSANIHLCDYLNSNRSIDTKKREIFRKQYV